VTIQEIYLYEVHFEGGKEKLKRRKAVRGTVGRKYMGESERYERYPEYGMGYFTPVD